MFAKKSWRADFCQRMYAPGLAFYRRKLAVLGFTDHNKVLDAGCGFGQWTLAMADLNQGVVGMDVLPERVVEGRFHNYANADFVVGTIEGIPFQNEFFDAVFCFSAIYFTDVPKTLKEFRRVLQDGGKLYLNSNGVGWYIYELIGKRRLEVLKTFFDSMMFRLTGKRSIDLKLISSIREMRREMEEAGFTQIKVLSMNEGTQLFRTRYFGLEGVFEMMAEA